jgi:hypothetical protein
LRGSILDLTGISFAYSVVNRIFQITKLKIKIKVYILFEILSIKIFAPGSPGSSSACPAEKSAGEPYTGRKAKG